MHEDTAEQDRDKLATAKSDARIKIERSTGSTNVVNQRDRLTIATELHSIYIR